MNFWHYKSVTCMLIVFLMYFIEQRSFHFDVIWSIIPFAFQIILLCLLWYLLSFTLTGMCMGWCIPGRPCFLSSLFIVMSLWPYSIMDHVIYMELDHWALCYLFNHNSVCLSLNLCMNNFLLVMLIKYFRSWYVISPFVLHLQRRLFPLFTHI